jgi:serine/threonine-protein kinase
LSAVDKDRWRVLSPHLDRGLELAGEARAAWLAALRAEDPALAAEIEALLDKHSALEREGFLAGASPARPARGAPGAPSADRIGPYRILRELGRGGMGCVYLAEQEGQDFRRLVALKVVEPGGAGAEVERRFRGERRILSGLEHPGIARFYDAGRSPDGRWFLALEYVQGPNLLHHARERDLPTAEKVRLFLQVLEAVEFAHQHGVVHRDLKPSNILVGPDGRARLLDFGIAKLIDPDPDVLTTETRTELRALTPAYASPEQFRGERVTPVSDVFALGVVLYELMAGVRPFAAHSTSRADLERAVLADDPDPPSAAFRPPARTDGRPPDTALRVRAKAGALGRDLDAICLKALRKEPGERYASAAAFAQDLRAYLEGRPVAARAGNRRYRVVRLFKRHRAQVATPAALALAVVSIVMAVSAYQRAERLRPPAPPTPRVFPFSDVGTIPVEELQRRFAEQPASVEAGAALALGLADDGRAKEAALILARLRQIPGKEDDPLTLYADASIHMDLDTPQRALVLLTRARDGALASGRGDLLAQIRAARGRLLSTLGEREEGQREMKLAVDDFRRAGDHASLTRVINDLAIEELQRGELARGEVLLEEAVSEGRAAGRPSEAALQNLGQLATYRGRPDLAEPRLREVVTLWRRSGSPRRVGHALCTLSEALRDLGRAREADPLLEESIVLLRRAGDEFELVESLHARAVADIASARLDGIDAIAADMASVSEAGGGRRAAAATLEVRGLAAATRNDLKAARQHFREARRLYVTNGDLDTASEMDVSWARAEHEAGNAQAALRLLDDALERLQGGGAGSPPAFFAEAFRARIDAEAGRIPEARRRLAALGEENARSPSVSRRLVFLASSAAVAGAEQRFGDARRDLQAALHAARAAGRTLDSLNLRLDQAAVERRAGDPVRAAAAARAIAAEAGALHLASVVARTTSLIAVRRVRG